MKVHLEREDLVVEKLFGLSMYQPFLLLLFDHLFLKPVSSYIVLIVLLQ
jgi:hypothetical protein